MENIINEFLVANDLDLNLNDSDINSNHLSLFMEFCSDNNYSLVYDNIDNEFIESEGILQYLERGETFYTKIDNDHNLFIFNDDFYLDNQSNMDYYDIVYTHDDKYEYQRDCVYGYISNITEGWFNPDDNDECIDFNDNWYLNSEIAFYHDVHYCGNCSEYNEGGCDYCNENNDNEEDSCYLFEYHSDNRVSLKTHNTQFAVGFEVEKEDSNIREKDEASELFYSTNWAKEQDGSLDDDSGFELVSPTFDLFDNEVIMQSFDKVETYLNASYSKNCGGHINYSIKDLQPIEVFKTIEGYMPLLYSLYENRLNNHFCQAKKADLMYESNDKYQAVAIKDNRIEFRIFSAVKSKTHLIWRLELIRIFALNPKNEVKDVLRDLCNKESALYIHLLKIFTPEQIKNKIGLFIKYSLEIEEINLNNLINDSFTFQEHLKDSVIKTVSYKLKVGDVVQIKNIDPLFLGGYETIAIDAYYIIEACDSTRARIISSNFITGNREYYQGCSNHLIVDKSQVIYSEEMTKLYKKELYANELMF